MSISSTEFKKPKDDSLIPLKAPADLQKIISIQQRLKLNISYKSVLNHTKKELGDKHAIDIPKQSKENLKRLKQRLRNAELMPMSDKKMIHYNKKHSNDILTIKEKELFKQLIKQKFYLHHTTSAELLDTIVKDDKRLICAPEAQRQGKQVRVATPEFGGIMHNVFFGLGLKNSSLPQFTRMRFAPKDYATVHIDLKSFAQNKPKEFSQLWSSGHFAHYKEAYEESKSSPIQFGETTFYWEMSLENSFNTAKKRYIKTFNFIRPDNHLKQVIEMGDEVAVGKDLFQFLALTFIERLRFIGGDIYHHLLDQPNDESMIASLFEKLFRVDDFEIHMPTQIKLAHNYTTIITPQKRKELCQSVNG